MINKDMPRHRLNYWFSLASKEAIASVAVDIENECHFNTHGDYYSDNQALELFSVYKGIIEKLSSYAPRKTLRDEFHLMVESGDEGPHWFLRKNDVSGIYSFSGIPWRVLANLDVCFDEEYLTDHGYEFLLGHLLYELTFDGYTEWDALTNYNKMIASFPTVNPEECISYEDAMKELQDYAEDRKNIKITEEHKKILFTPDALEEMKAAIRDRDKLL